tara:strand:+ start:12300 stop:13322 length:1023 start_codon:yes stop_codon:yes gene_type:complete
MEHNKINTLLIGLGQIGFNYDFSIKYEIDKPESSAKIITHARSVVCHPDFNLVAGIDNNKDACKKFNFIYENPTYCDIDSFLVNEKNNIDLVIIAVNPQNQPKLIEEVINKINLKVLLIEKPIAISMQESIKVELLCKSKPNLIVCINYGRRYSPLIQNWSEIISSGKIGEFLYGNIIYGKGIISNGSHFLNLAQSWIQNLEYFKTFDKGKKINDFDREMSFLLRCKKNNSFLGLHSIGKNKLRAGEIDLWFEGGRLCLINNGKSLYFWPRLNTNSPMETYDSLTEIPQIYSTKNEKSQYFVIDSIKNIFMNNDKINVPCTLNDGLETMSLINNALKSQN